MVDAAPAVPDQADALLDNNGMNMHAIVLQKSQAFKCTEFCPTFLKYGTSRQECEQRGYRCHFGHADEEMQPKSFFDVFKTQACPEWTKTNGYCKKDNKKCAFLHDEVQGQLEVQPGTFQRVLVDVEMGTMRVQEQYDAQTQESVWRQQLLKLPIHVEFSCGARVYKTKKCINWHGADDIAPSQTCLFGHACMNYHDELNLAAPNGDRILILRRKRGLCWTENKARGTWALTRIPAAIQDRVNARLDALDSEEAKNNKPVSAAAQHQQEGHHGRVEAKDASPDWTPPSVFPLTVAAKPTSPPKSALRPPPYRVPFAGDWEMPWGNNPTAADFYYPMPFSNPAMRGGMKRKFPPGLYGPNPKRRRPEVFSLEPKPLPSSDSASSSSSSSFNVPSAEEALLDKLRQEEAGAIGTSAAAASADDDEDGVVVKL